MKQHPFNLRKWQHWLALGFGSGLAPKAPGTFGTLAAIPLLYLVWPYGLYAMLAFIVLGTVLGIYVCDLVSRDIGIADHAYKLLIAISYFRWVKKRTKQSQSHGEESP